MPILSKTDARLLASLFSNFSDKVALYRRANTAQLSPERIQKLADLEYNLSEESAKMSALAGLLTLGEVKGSVAEISAAVTKAETFLKRVASVQKGLNVATSVLLLAAGIAGKDPKAIGKELKTLKKLIT